MPMRKSVWNELGSIFEVVSVNWTNVNEQNIAGTIPTNWKLKSV